MNGRRAIARSAGSTALWVLLAIVVALGGCTTLDRSVPRTPSAALSDAEARSTTLGRTWEDAAPADPALSAFRLLPNNLEAVAARIAMINAAERTLDMQYYIFTPDDCGLFIVDRLVTSADRGVRVRILIDDMCAHGIEEQLAAFDAHPNVEVRLFNPWTQRSGVLIRGLEFLFSPRLNHRMHNKLFIADGIVAVLGGRNIADEYFTLNDEYDFRDLDVAAAGPVVGRANQLFDAFWNGSDAIPIAGLKPRPDTDDAMLEGARAQLVDHRDRMKTSPYAEAVRATDFVQQLGSHSNHWIWAPGRIVGDEPEKTEHANNPQWTGSLAHEAKDTFFSAETELLISSPYFVPGKELTKQLGELEAGGVQVRIITNSQASTDVPFVYAAYSKYRHAMLKSGIELFELRKHSASTTPDVQPEFGSNNSSLHAKTFVVDGKSVYIGSLNLDPRSVVLNTEIGVIIESPQLAESVANSIESLMAPAWSYSVSRSPEGLLRWTCNDADGNEIHLTTDPDTSFWERIISGIGGLLPIENQL